MAVWDSEKRRTFINKALVAKLASMVASKRESKHVYDYMSVLRSIYTVKKKKDWIRRDPIKNAKKTIVKGHAIHGTYIGDNVVIEKQSSAQ